MTKEICEERDLPKTTSLTGRALSSYPCEFTASHVHLPLSSAMTLPMVSAPRLSFIKRISGAGREPRRSIGWIICGWKADTILNLLHEEFLDFLSIKNNNFSSIDSFIIKIRIGRYLKFYPKINMHRIRFSRSILMTKYPWNYSNWNQFGNNKTFGNSPFKVATDGEHQRNLSN